MDAQSLIALAIVFGAAAYLARSTWRKLAAARKPKSGCGGDGCCPH